MKGLPILQLKWALYFALIIVTAADSDESDESNESNESNLSSKKLYRRITSLLDVIDSRHHQNGGTGSNQVQQPYLYPYAAYPYYSGPGGVPYPTMDYQRSTITSKPSVPETPQTAAAATSNIALLPVGYTPFNEYARPSPPYPAYYPPPMYPSYPNPLYPYPNMPTEKHQSEHKNNHHHRGHSSQEDTNHSNGYIDGGNGLSTVDHTLKSSNEYQEAGHYIGPYQGRPLGLDRKQ